MSQPQSAADVLDREFLAIRARLLDVAAMLDRIDRASGNVDDDDRMGHIAQTLAMLADGQPDRAERLQRLFSLDYDPNWRNKFDLA